MKAPIYSIQLGDLDISGYVENLRYEDIMDKDNMVELKIKTEHALELLAMDDLVSGQVIKFQFGFIGSVLSAVNRVELTDIEAVYAEDVSLTLRGLDRGNQLKKSTSNKIWKAVTSKDIVAEIAKRYGLEYEVEPSSLSWASLPQGNASDFEFLQKLALMETGGDFICYIRNETLYFVKRGLGKDSQVTYTYGEDESIISFKPTIRETTDDGSSVQTTVVGFDDENPVVDAIDNATEESSKSTGEYKVVYNENGEKLGYRKPDGQFVDAIDDDVFTKVQRTGKSLVSAMSNPVETKNLGNSVKKAATLKLVEATLMVDGNPLLDIDAMLTMEGVAERHLGNWYTNSITHIVSSSGYICSIGLQKNASKKKTAATADKPNTTVGEKPEEQKDEIVANIYNENGEKVGQRYQSGKKEMFK